MSARRSPAVPVVALLLAVGLPGALWASSTTTSPSGTAHPVDRTSKAATDADPAAAAVAVSEQFLTALAAGDAKAVCALISDQGRQGLGPDAATCEKAVRRAADNPQTAAAYQDLANTPLSTDRVLLGGDQARVDVAGAHAVLLSRTSDGVWRVGGLT